MDVWTTLEEARAAPPLVHCITNTVAANLAANAVIAVGGSPVMASEPTEVAQVTKLADALTVNIGTCSPGLVEAIRRATAEANARGIPWVLDPVGVAATKARQDICCELLALGPAVVRGNASEIVALAVCTGTVPRAELSTRGLDSTLTPEAAAAAADALARRYRAVVAVSGARDYVVDGLTAGSRRTLRRTRVANGHAMMAQITASGCALTAILGCFLARSVRARSASAGADAGADASEAVSGDAGETGYFWRVVEALSYYAVAGQLAAQTASGTGSMHVGLLDRLSSMTRGEYDAHARPCVDLSVYLVTDPVLTRGRELADVVRRALEGGATLVQLREKDCDSGEFLARARAVKALCDRHRVPLLINDRVDIALAVDCAGVHIGQSDLPVAVARRLLGPTKVIGLSVSTAEEAEAARDERDIDYVGVGPIWPTATKKDAKQALGVDGLRERLAANTHLAVAIGGISAANAQDVLDVAGVHGVAVVSALTAAEDPAAAARQLLLKQ